MKHGKAPTKAQKIMLRSYRFDPANWLIVKATSTETVIQHRYTGTVRTIKQSFQQSWTRLHLLNAMKLLQAV